jgi:hypothetical protein
MGIEPTSDRMGISTVSLKVFAECWAQNSPSHCGFKESWRVLICDLRSSLVSTPSGIRTRIRLTPDPREVSEDG